MGMSAEEEAALEGKMGKKSKKKKQSEANASEEVNDCTGTHSEYINVKSYAEVDDDYQKEKEKKKKKKKKKKRKLEPVENNDKSNYEIHMVGEEKRCLQTVDGTDLGNDSEFKVREEKKKRHKEDRRKDKNESLSSLIEILKDKDIVKDEGVKGQKSSQKNNIAGRKNEEEQTDKKKNKKGGRNEEVGDFKGKKKTTTAEEVGKVIENYDVDICEQVEKKKRKREKEKDKDDLCVGEQEMMAEELGNESTMIEDKDFGDSEGNAYSNRNKDRMTKNGNKGNRKKPNSVETGSEDPKPKRKSKKVRFSDHVEVFPSSNGPRKEKEKNQEEQLLQGKRFSPEEDEMVKGAVFNYVEVHGLGEEGLNMVLHCKSYPKIKSCWKEIGAVLPHRPYKAIYYRAHSLFERDENRSWTTEELQLVRKFHEDHGPKWKKFADALGKHRVHLKDAWRRIKRPDMKKGHWSQEEYQTLFDLVNIDLRMKAFEEKKSKHGMLRDNICWTAISDKLSTRTDPTCCIKWYNQLTSPMVAEGKWADADDYRLLDSLSSMDACCIEDVDWDNLLDHRSGDVCRKRWKQMVRHIGEHGNKSFSEQVEILSERYCPDVLEARDAWDSKLVAS